MLKKVQFFFAHGKMPPAPNAASQSPPDAPPASAAALPSSPAEKGDPETASSVASPASPRDSVIDSTFKGTTHPTPSTTHHYNRFLGQKGQYEAFKAALRAHDKNLTGFVKDSASASAALESLCDAVPEKEYAAEAMMAIKLCRHGLEKAMTESPNVASPTSSLMIGVEEGLAMFPKVQASYTKLGDLSLEMDHYSVKLAQVTAAAEAAIAAVENEVVEEGEEPSAKLAKKKEKAVGRKERNTTKLADATAAVAACNDEFLQLCEDTEMHRASIINEPNNLADLIEKQKALFRAFYLSFDRNNSSDIGVDIPPAQKDLLRPSSGGIAKISKGIRRRSVSASVAINNLKKHGGRPKSGVDFEIENEAEYLGGEMRYLQLKKDIDYVITTVDRFPSSLEAVFDSLMEVATTAIALANDCLDVDLVGDDDDFEGMSAKAKARTILFVENINEIKSKLGSTSKLTSCYLADVENKVSVVLRPLITEMIHEPRFPLRKQMALDHSHYSQKLVEQNGAKVKLTESEATEEKLQKATENIARTTEKLNTNKDNLVTETARLLDVFEDLEKKRESVLTTSTNLYFELTCDLWKHASDSIVTSIQGIDLTAEKKAPRSGPTAPPPAAAPPPADIEDDEDGTPSSPTLQPPPTVGEQSRRASSARLSDAEVAQALNEDIEDLKEFGLDSPPVPDLKNRSERTVSGATGIEGGEEGDAAELNHVKLAKSKFGDGLASDMIKKAEDNAAEKLAEGNVETAESRDVASDVDESVYSSPLKEEDADEVNKQVETEGEGEKEEGEKSAAEPEPEAEAEAEVSVDAVEAAEAILAEGREGEGGEEKPKESD